MLALGLVGLSGGLGAGGAGGSGVIAVGEAGSNSVSSVGAESSAGDREGMVSSFGDGDSTGSVTGPSQPSCRPRIYSFHVCLPMTMSPLASSLSVIPSVCRIDRNLSSGASSASSSGESPLTLRRCFRIRSANPNRTSPCMRPSTTSQSTPPATSIGFTYSVKYSREVLRVSPGGAER